MSVADDQRLMTVPEVASAIRVAPATLYRWVEEDRVPSVRIGSQIRIARRWLDRILAVAEGEAEAGKPQT